MHVACLEGVQNLYKNLVVLPEGKRPVTFMHRLKANINMGHAEIVYNIVD